MRGGSSESEKLARSGRADPRRLAGAGVNILGLLVLAASLVISQAGPDLLSLLAIVLSVLLLDFSHRLRA